MSQAAELRGRIDNMRDLRAVVGAMRALAAARLRHAERGLEGIRAYATVARSALSDALAMIAEPPPATPSGPVRRVAIVFGAEHGFVGAFHGAVMDAAAAAATAGAQVWIAGRRAAIAARERAVPIARELDTATSWDSLESAARDIADPLTDLLDQRTPVQVELVYTTRTGVTVQRVVPVDLSGLDRPAGSPPPAHYMDPYDLFDRLCGEYLLAQVALASTESFAAENRARLRAMDEAHRSIERKLADLARHERSLRQAEITTELLEVVAGAAVVGART